MVKFLPRLALMLVGILLMVLVGCADPGVVTEQQQAILDVQYAQGRYDFLHGNYKLAFQELYEPAVHCEPSAEYAIGYMYFYGKGIVLDIDMAQYWMRRACKHGYPAAPAALAKIDRIVGMQQKPFSLPAPNLKLRALQQGLGNTTIYPESPTEGDLNAD